VTRETDIVIVDQIEPKILTIRGHKVLLDNDLAALYGVATKRLNEQVKRNHARFPPAFMFALTPEEKAEVVANCDHLSKLKFSPKLPNVFTEHGVVMAASILNTPRAVEVNIFVVQVFVKLRQFAMKHQEILKKLADLERKVGANDEAIQHILLALRQLMTPPVQSSPKRRIGFLVDSEEKTRAKRKS